MKMDMSAKPTGENMPQTNEGTYDQEHLEEMLEHYLSAKKIEADPALFATLKDYAMSKNQMVKDLFNAPPKTTAPKSLADLKKKYNEVAARDLEESED